MAKATLPTNYQDDILKSTMNGKRRYTITDNSDGTKTLEDATQYDKVGSNFGAADINKTNTAVNAAADASKIIDNVNDIKANTQDGYMMGALAGKQLIQDLGGAKIITEGSGAATKYYAQMGADAASKKLLGSKNLTLFKKALIMDGTNVQRYWLFRLEEMDVSSYSSLRVECTDSFQLTCNDIVLSQSGTINLKGIDTISLTLRLNGASNPYYPITVELLV